MKMLRKVLLIVLIVCLAYLAVYAVQEQRVRKQNETIGRPVQELRMASTPIVEQGVARAVTENPTEAPTDAPTDPPTQPPTEPPLVTTAGYTTEETALSFTNPLSRSISSIC